MKLLAPSLLLSAALATQSFKIDITKVPRTSQSTTIRSKQAFNSEGTVMRLQEEDPDTFFVKELFTYPDEHHFMGSIYLGSERSKAMVVFDTGSAFTVVTCDQCNNCDSEVYKPGDSQTSVD